MPSSHESTDFVQISEQMNSHKSNCRSWSHQIMKKSFYEEAENQTCEVYFVGTKQLTLKSFPRDQGSIKVNSFSQVSYTVDKPIRNIVSYANWLRGYISLLFVPTEPSHAAVNWRQRQCNKSI
jgi:hypothetical protein